MSCVVNPVPPYSRLIGLQRALAKVTGSNWLMENGDQLRLARTGETVFTFEHIFVPGEFEREAASAGLSVMCTNREEMMFALQPAFTRAAATAS